MNPMPVSYASRLDAAVEALVLSADRPLAPARLAEAISACGLFGATKAGEPGGGDGAGNDSGQGNGPADAHAGRGPAVQVADVEASIERLNRVYDEGRRAFRIERVAGGVRAFARPEHAPVLAALHAQRSGNRLSRPAIETLAIVAYQQPVTRARLEAIRGVACGETLKTLVDRRLVTIVGRAEELGRPMLYGTTRQFLDAFGLASLKDLPPTGLAAPREGQDGAGIAADAASAPAANA